MSVPRRALTALALSIPMLLAAFPVPAAAKDPGFPLPGYTPAFVTQWDVGPTEDCLWAATAMLLDKWSAGEWTIGPRRLRSLSGDRTGGSNFVDLRRAADRLGVDLRTSPDGGDHITWGTLLKRLRQGGGAVLLGDYHDLPRHYGRWSPAFWEKTGKKDNHALYLDRVNRAGTSVWVMDPLAPAGWTGEWIPVWALRSFAWQGAGGGLWAAMTPRAKPAPFAGVEFGEPSSAGAESRVRVEWPIEATPRGWRPPGTDVDATFTRIDAPVAPPAGALMVVAAPDRDDRLRVAVEDDHLAISAGVPTTPGVYEVTLGIRERRFGRVVLEAPLTVYVAGERRASTSVRLAGEVAEPRERLNARIVVSNTGITPWGEPLVPAAPPVERRTRLVLRWVDAENGRRVIEIDRKIGVDLAPGESSVFEIDLAAPGPGEWLLVVGATDALDGSFASGGSREGVARLTVSSRQRPAD